LNPATTDDVLEGVRDGLVFFPLYLPLATAYVISAQLAGLEGWTIVLWSALIYAGAAQLACLEGAGAGAGLGQLLVIAFMANARHGFVALGLSSYLRTTRAGSLPFLAFTMATPSLGLLPAKARRGGSVLAYGLAVQGVQWAQWVSFSAAAVWLGPMIPPSWRAVLAFAGPTAIIGVTAPMVRDDLRNGALVAGIGAVLGLGLTWVWPPQLSAIAAAIVGALATLLIPEDGVDGQP